MSGSQMVMTARLSTMSCCGSTALRAGRRMPTPMRGRTLMMSGVSSSMTDSAPDEPQLPLSAAECLREIAAEPLDDTLSSVIALVHVMRTHDVVAGARLVSQYLADEGHLHDAVLQLVTACHLLGCVLDEQQIDTEVAARWSQVAFLRARPR
jgi:hypothetical protein